MRKAFDFLSPNLACCFQSSKLMVYVATPWLFLSLNLLKGKTGCDQATPVENGKQSNADAPGGHHFAKYYGIFIKMICFMKTFDLNWVLTMTTTKYIFRVRRLTTSSAVLRRTGIQMVAGINPTTSRIIHRNIEYWSCEAKQEVKKAVHIDGHTIRQAREIKLLGVIPDVNLQFSEHIKQICTKTSRRIGVLSRLKESDSHNSKTNNL